MSDEVPAFRPLAVVGLAIASAAPPEPERDGVATWLGQWWSLARTAGLDEPDGELPLDPPLVGPSSDPSLKFLAARRRANGSGAARYFHLHDVHGVLVRLRADDPASAMGHLAGLGNGELPPAVFGQARLLVGTAEDPTQVQPNAALPLLPDDYDDGLRYAALTDDGILITEAENATCRTFAVVVPQAHTEWADRLTWIQPGPSLASFLRYLMHAAKLRYQVQVFRRDAPALRDREERLDKTLENLFHLHAKLGERRGRLERALDDAQTELGDAHAESAQLAVMATQLRDLQRSAQTAVHNLKAHMPQVSDERRLQTETSFERDLNLAQWLDTQAEQELAYLASARERVTEAQQLTALRLDQARQDQARLANWLTVLQTSALGAIIGCLAVVEAWDSTFFRSNPRLRWPLLVTVATLSLALPSLALRWVSGLGRRDYVAAAACGSTLSWTVMSTIEAPTLWTLIAAVAGGVLAAASLYQRHQSEHVD